MSDDVKQVKVDNWGIYFLQRLKHFFNRTDYCDLTLQFQDNAQLKVHRLVLSACTEYFELLERTCEMYEDCLVMPDDLQADIVVPIVNFMYTGQLEFRMELLEKLHQCSEIMHMPVLTKLLDSHRPKTKSIQSCIPVKRIAKRVEGTKEIIKSVSATEFVTTTPITYKRSHQMAFEKTTVYRDKKVYLPVNAKPKINNGARTYREPSPIPLDQRFNKKVVLGDPRPTRYELPEELDCENIFENSFSNISYASQPLMVHPETRKQYSKRPRLEGEASSSKKSVTTMVDIMECKKPVKSMEDALFEDSIPDDNEMFSESFVNVKAETSKDPNQLFDTILERNEDSKVTIETKSNKSSANLDHAKIISEVLKKYPHLVKSNKNIKLKILNTPTKNVKKQQKLSPAPSFEKAVKKEPEKEVDYTFETDVLDSKLAAKLIALGAENIDGPWICLICGAPGKAMNFTSYHKFRRHLVEVHNEKPVLNICEYCGQKSTKRNYLLHHMYTKHGVEPPLHYHFPKCSQCNYIALTEALLVKHKHSHGENKNFRCNVCPSAFNSSNQLLVHIQNTGHKYSAERKTNLQCIYCQKVFMRESNLCAHLKTYHKKEAVRDGIIDDSEDEHEEKKNIVKNEPIVNDFEELDIQYQIQQRPDGNITVVTKKASEPTTNTKQKILNSGLSTQTQSHQNKSPKASLNTQNEYIQEINLSSNDTHEEIVTIDNNEYIVRNNQLIPRRPKPVTEDFILSDHGNLPSTTPTTSMEFTNIHTNVQENLQHANMLLKNQENLTQSIPIYVSNEDEYKAIMAANQPIIFDSDDSNKTLTVLTAPHASSLEATTINLDTTQPNDMMIIQDQYPLNVSEAVASENSNIVVVYSHQVGDQNKQYQLLTTQGLGAQFVQSSTILTQNFETVTTTTPVMNAHVLEKQVEAWQNNLHQIVDTDQIEITPVSSIQTIVETHQAQITTSAESNNDMIELPQVDMPSKVTETTNSISVMPVCQSQVIIAQNIPITHENIEGECEDNTQNISSMEIDHDSQIDEHVKETEPSTKLTEIDDGNVIAVEEEVIEKKDTCLEEETEHIESQAYAQPESEKNDDSLEDPEHTESQTYTQPESDIQPDIAHIDEAAECHDIETDQPEEINKDNSDTVEIDNIQLRTVDQVVPEPNVDTKKVDSLTSEWSEEDTQDRQEADLVEATQHNDIITQDNVQQTNMEEMCVEVEESIENIQQEVQKQFAVANPPVGVTEPEKEVRLNDTANSSQDESGPQENSGTTVITDPAVTQEKISSLLNDWEDNDSQEDNNSMNENVQESDEVIKSTLIKTIAEEKPDSEKQDKIKSLVSDWDEDDDEIKE